MIKLNISMYDEIKDEYYKEIIPIIKQKYINHYDDNLYFESIKLNDFLSTNNSFDEKKVKNIILFDFINIDSNDEILANYLKVGCLISYANYLKINKISNIKKQEVIKEFVEKYRCSWIEKYIELFPNYYQTKDSLKLMIKSIKEEYEQLSNSINKIINYDDISNDLRHRILVSCGISVCPYCNRQYISSYKKKNQNRTSADLDHFYLKDVFALFSLSLYNFIPSCPTCNRNFKKTSKRKLLYPFKRGFENDALFRVSYNSTSDLKTILGQNDKFDLKLDIKDSDYKEEIDNCNKTFNLELIYQTHKNYVQELKFKQNYIYTDSYINMMNKQFKELHLNKNQINIMLYGYTFDDELDKDKILSKLTKDIVNK